MNNLTFTIGISAYNEEKNISKLLNSIYLSDLKNLILKKVIIISDASTDKTEKIIKSFSNKLPLQLIINKKRKGKIINVQKILESFNSDMLGIFDADVILGSKHTLFELFKPFQFSNDIGLVGSNAQPSNPKTWIESAVYSSFRVYDRLRYEINSGNNIFSVKGCGLALSSDFARKVQLPLNTYAEDAYLYFKCLEQGYQFRLAPSAIVKFRLPATLSDHFKQNRRYLSSPNNLEKYFGVTVVSHYYLPKDLLAKHILRQIIINPISTINIFFINLLVKLSLLLTKQPDVSIWSTSLSTRKISI